MLTNLIKFLDPSVKHWDDKKRGYLDKSHCPPGRPKLQCSYSYELHSSANFLLW
ncbi:hypothetical protein [Wolbachia endosymbiont (group A) of Brachyopa scutellaris]|uniref:hypothetical protein n=1 Tax=Wolbachia endosymbiont (group A) of Brachyopa scutellaris TaxID=3066140 RepID=UPI003132DE69